jgi:predicted nucleic acid-binding protein
VVLDYFNQDVTHHAVLDDVLRDIRMSNGSRLIVTSTYTIVETVRIQEEFQNQALRDSAEDIMDFFWNDRSILRLVDLHVGIARRARRLQRQVADRGGKLTAPDATHLATASWLEVDEMHSYDRDHLRLDGTMPFRIREPHVPYGTLFEAPPRQDRDPC